MSQTSPNDQVLTKLGPVAQAVINDDILSAMGLGNISETEKNEFYSMMVSTVQDRVLARILDELSQDEQHQLTQLLSHTGAAEAEAFIAEHIQNLDDLTMQEALLYKAEMIEKLNSQIYHYTKRQMTWFRRDKEIKWFDVSIKNFDKKMPY